MTRRQELGWRNGYYAARERIPDGYARIRNGRRRADGAVAGDRGAEVLVEVAGADLRHGFRYASRTGVKATLLLGADGAVHRHTGGASAPTIGSITPASRYSTAQYYDRGYIATGGAPAVVAAAGGAAVLAAGPAGLPTPAAPALSFTAFVEPTNPAEAISYLATLRARGEIYGVGAGTNFYKYRISNNDWPSMAATPLPVPRLTYPAFGVGAGDQVVYNRGADSVWQGDNGVEGRRTFWFDAATAAWSINLPLWTGFPGRTLWWAPKSQVVEHQGATYAILYVQAGGNYPCIVRIVKDVLNSRTECQPMWGADPANGILGGGGGFAMDAQTMASDGTSLYIFTAGTGVGQEYFVRWDGGAGFSPALNRPGGGFELQPGDRLIYDEDRLGFLYLFRPGSATYWEYNTASGAWQTLVATFTPNTAVAGGDPVNNLLYFFAAGADFTAAVLPGMLAGGLGTYKYQIQQANLAGRSAPSVVAQIDNVPDGATINVDLPAADPAATDWYIFRNPSRLDTLTIGELDTAPAATDIYYDTAEVKTIGAPPPPGTGASSMPQGKYVAAWENRLWFGNLTDGTSDVAFSRDGEPETFEPQWRISFGPNDGDEITGLAPISGALLVLKERSIHVWAGDAGEPPDVPATGFRREVARGVGCVAPASLAVARDRAYFVGADGVYAADAGGAVRISDAVEAVFAASSNAVGFIDARGWYNVTFDGATFYVYNPDAQSWETERTIEAHRTAAVAGAFLSGDEGRQIAVAGERAIRFAEDGLPTDAADPFGVVVGPHGDEVFEADVAALRAFVRYAGDVDLIWASDNAASAPEVARTISLGARADVGTTRRTLPTRCYGRRMFFEARADVGAAVVEAVSLDLARLGAGDEAP